ncbi:MAG: hypothetical protein C0483_26050 [Pirellula sp.]|nr:hypothetical protein [Pirellula sp.]
MSDSRLVAFCIGLDIAVSAEATSLFSRYAVDMVPLASWEALLARADVTRAGCILATLNSQSDSGVVQAIADLQNRSPLSTIFLAASPATRLIVQLLRMAPVEVLDWPVEAHRLESVVAEACRDSIARQTEAAQSNAMAVRVSQLRREELDVLDLMLRGKLNKNIASTLNIALRTVEARRKRIFTKLGTRSVAEIAVIMRQFREGAPRKPHFLSRQATTPSAQPVVTQRKFV